MGRSNIIGRAGAGLEDAAWAANQDVAAQGRKGEVLTARALNTLVQGSDAVVLHDLRIPIPGFTANIDHAVVSGQSIFLIDSKRWSPSFYWTLGEKTFRGTKRFKVGAKGKVAYPAESKTMPMAVDAITRFCEKNGVPCKLEQPIIVIWPSSERKSLSVRFLRMHGSKPIVGDRLYDLAKSRKMFKGKAADERIVKLLSQLVVGQRRGRDESNYEEL